MPVAQPAGLYPDAPPRIKKPSKGSKINKQRKPKFAKRPELSPISYHVTPYENPDNPPEYKREGGRFWKVEKMKGSAATESREGLFKKEKADHPKLSDEQIWKIVNSHVKPGNKNPERAVEGQTPHEQDKTKGLQPEQPLMRMANPADLSLSELMQKEREAHPDMDEKELEELVKMHIRELGEPTHQEHQEDYERSHSTRGVVGPNSPTSPGKTHPVASALHFGVDTGIPISHRFHAIGLDHSGNIRLVGTFLDYEATTNGWHIDPAEEQNIVDAPSTANITVRVAHSKEPERVVGKYTKFQANEGDGCTDAYGNPLGRHIDFEAVINPQDPQLRTNILNNWVNDISPGLDAEVFCGECNEPWGLDAATNKLVKTCEHTEAEGVLRNIKPKEGSIVTEPAFEGRTQFHPTFTFGMAMNGLLSPEKYEDEAVEDSRKTRERAAGSSMTRRQISKGDRKIMSNNSERKEGTDAKKIAQELLDHGFFTASETKTLNKMNFWKAEDEDKSEDRMEDEDALIRAAFPLIKKAQKRAADYASKLKDLQPGDDARMEDEDQHPYKAEDEDEVPEQKGVPSPGDPHRDKHDKAPVTYGEDQQPTGPGQLKGAKFTDEERQALAQAEKIILEDKKKEVLGHANVVLERQRKREMLAEVERARKLFEASKDAAGMKACDEQIYRLKSELAPQVASTVQGAQVPGSNPTILAAESYGSKTIVVGPHGEKLEVKAAAARPTVNAETFAATVSASILPALRAAPRLNGVSEEAWGRQTRRLQ